MVKIPRIDPTLNTTTDAAIGTPLQKTSSIGEGIAEVGQTVSEVAERFKQASLVAEKTKAQNELERQLSDIQQRAASDSDNSPKRLKDYEDEISKAVDDASLHITLPAERSIFGLEAKGKSNITRTRVNGFFMKKTIDQGKADLDVYLTNKKDQFIRAESSLEKETAMVERDDKIREMQKTGFLTPAEATRLREEQDKDWARSQVEYDIATDPDMAVELLESKAYPDVMEEERVELLKDAQAAQKALKKRSEDAEKEVVKQTTDDLYDKLFRQELDITEIYDVQEIIGGKTAGTIKKALLTQQRGDIKDLTEDNESAETYVALIDSLISDEIDNFQMKRVLVDAFADGVLDTKEAAQLSEIKGKLEDIKFNRETNPLSNSIKAVKGWFGRNNPDDAELINSIRNIINHDPGVEKSHEEMQKHTARVIGAAQQKINPNAGRYAEGEVITTDNGSWKVVGYDEDGEPLVQRQ